MAAAAAAAAAPANMDQYLEHTLGFASAGMRQNIIDEGFDDLQKLVEVDKEWLEDLRSNIRESTTGKAADRYITMVHEELLWKVVLWTKVRYLTQRPLDFADATLASINAVSDWYESLFDELPDSYVASFSTNLNKRTWFESIQNFLAAKKGRAGTPLTYVISTTKVIDPDAPDPGFGLPTFHEDIASRGRHDGVFWEPDNKTVWRLLELKCRGTNAWHLIAQYESTRNGAQAYRTLYQCMGESTWIALRAQAMRTIHHSCFDGKSKHYTLKKHINRYRQAFHDLGPSYCVFSEAYKVELFLNSWQVPDKDHLASLVRGDPHLCEDFEATVTFLSHQMEMAALRTLKISEKKWDPDKRVAPKAVTKRRTRAKATKKPKWQVHDR